MSPAARCRGAYTLTAAGSTAPFRTHRASASQCGMVPAPFRTHRASASRTRCPPTRHAAARAGKGRRLAAHAARRAGRPAAARLAPLKKPCPYLTLRVRFFLPALPSMPLLPTFPVVCPWTDFGEYFVFGRQNSHIREAHPGERYKSFQASPNTTRIWTKNQGESFESMHSDGPTGERPAEGDGVKTPPAHGGESPGAAVPGDSAMGGDVTPQGAAEEEGVQTAEEGVQAVGSVPLAPDSPPRQSVFEEEEGEAPERTEPEGEAECTEPEGEVPEHTEPDGEAPERAEPEGEVPERTESAERPDDQGQAERCHAQADHGAGNWSASQLKAELKARGISELAITACSEKRELVELLAAATDIGRGMADGTASEAGAVESTAPEAAAGHAAVWGAPGADDALPRQSPTENVSPGEPEAAAARQMRCYRRITPAPADAMRTGRLWNSPSQASKGATSVSNRLLLSPGASQVLPRVLEIASRSSSGATCASALSTAGYAGIASRAHLREFQDRVHALDCAPLVLKHW